MALAIFSIDSQNENSISLNIDIGNNSYFEIWIGEGQQNTNGVKTIEHIHHMTKLEGPLDDSQLGRNTFSIPRNVLNNRSNNIQLMSFRTKDKKGICVSEIMALTRSMNFSNEMAISPKIFSMRQTDPIHHAQFQSYSAPFTIRENKVSNAMFLAGLMPMIGSIVQRVAPTVLQNLPNILGSLLGNNASPSAPAAAAPAATVGSSAPATAPPTSAPPIAPDASAQIVQLLNDPQVSALLQNILGQTLNGTSRTPVSARASALQYQLKSKYSEAKIAPALLAALPALMPLLQNLLSPETIGRVLDAPQRMVGAVADGLVKVGEVAIQSHEQDLRHLRELNPGTGPAVDSLLAAFSMAIAENKKLVGYKKSKQLTIQFDEMTSMDCDGKNCIMYRYGLPLRFPFTLQSPKPIQRCMIQLCIKETSSAKILVLKNFKYAKSNDIKAQPPTLDKEDYQELKPNQEYLVTLDFICKNGNKQNVGCYQSQVIHLISNYAFSTVTKVGTAIPLNDIKLHRSFWHQLWQTTYTSEFKRLRINLKYYCQLNAEKSGIGRMETLTKLEKTDDDYERYFKMKTGLQIGIADLNLLTHTLTKNPMLNQEQLQPLSNPDFLENYHTMSQDILKMNGFNNEITTLWAFPDVSIHDIVLKKVAGTNGNGLINKIEDEIIQLAMPTAINLIGTKNV